MFNLHRKMKALKLYMKMKKRDQRRFGPARAPPAG